MKLLCGAPRQRDPRRGCATFVGGCTYSVAERSFPLLNLLEMLCQPHAQFLLHRWSSLQDQLHKAQCLKNFEVPPSIHDNMRALGAQLLTGDRLTRLVGKAPPRLRVG